MMEILAVFGVLFLAAIAYFWYSLQNGTASITFDPTIKNGKKEE